MKITKEQRSTIVSFIKSGFARLGQINVSNEYWTVMDFRQAYAKGVVDFNRFLRRNDPNADLFDAYFSMQNNEEHLMSAIRSIHKTWR